MSEIISNNPIVKSIFEGDLSKDLIDMLLSKQLALTEEEYLESLVFVLNDESNKTKAVAQLKQIDDNIKANYVVKPKANHKVSYYILLEALNKKSHQIISKTIRNMALPVEFLLKIAEEGDANMLEMLLDNQIKLIAYPEILEEIEKNQAITKYIEGKIKELREFYLDQPELTDIPKEDVMEDAKNMMSQEAGKGEGDEDDEGLLDDSLEQKVMTTLQQINQMSITDRIKLALTGSKTHRMILVRDSNKLVTLAVLESPKISADEIVLLVNNKSTPGELISIISRNREWTKNYAVMNGLINNPKTPIKDALGYIKKLHIKDLHLISRDKNINPVVRKLAVNYYKEKTGIKK
jgi:hypothetical protein